MTESTREILDRFQVRKTGAQKSAFIEYVQGLAREWGYSCRVESGSFGVKNIVVGDISRAKIVYGAHYDTAPVLPFPNFITPKNFAVYLLYNFVIILGIVAISALVGGVCGVFSLSGGIATLAVRITYVLLLLLLLVGPANKHTANDNTSGVTLLIDIMRELPQDKRDEVAFVFFDLEEAGLIGSSAFEKAHRAQMKDKLLVNFDCVSDGDHILLITRKGSRRWNETLAKAFPSSDGFAVEVVDKGVFYPSDQARFNCGVGVAALNSTKRGILYTDKIHTKHDTVCNEENIDFLVEGSIRLAEII